MTQDFKDWIGRKIERHEVINERMIAEFDATLSPNLFDTGAVPLGIHWCLSPGIVNPDQLGGDGHPKLGQFIPDVDLPHRMWAGGELKLHGQFKSGDVVHKQSVGAWANSGNADVNLAATKLGRVLKSFSYRGVSPLILGGPFNIDATEADGMLNLRTISSAGVVTMTATVPQLM